jgi:hypothetical protein
MDSFNSGTLKTCLSSTPLLELADLGLGYGTALAVLSIRWPSSLAIKMSPPLICVRPTRPV